MLMKLRRFLIDAVLCFNVLVYYNLKLGKTSAVGNKDTE